MFSFLPFQKKLYRFKLPFILQDAWGEASEKILYFQMSHFPLAERAGGQPVARQCHGLPRAKPQSRKDTIPPKRIVIPAPPRLRARKNRSNAILSIQSKPEVMPRNTATQRRGYSTHAKVPRYPPLPATVRTGSARPRSAQPLDFRCAAAVDYNTHDTTQCRPAAIVFYLDIGTFLCLQIASFALTGEGDFRYLLSPMRKERVRF